MRDAAQFVFAPGVTETYMRAEVDRRCQEAGLRVIEVVYRTHHLSYRNEFRHSVVIATVVVVDAVKEAV